MNRFNNTLKLIYEEISESPTKKFYTKVGSFDIFIVDGKIVRTMSKDLYDFSDYATFVSFKDFPKDQIWINSELDAKERDIAIADALHEIHSYWKNHNKIKAITSSLKYDKDIRIIADAAMGLEHLKIKEYHSDRVYVEDDVKVIIVDGEKARLLWAELKYGNPFIQGGHHYVYPIIPEDEIWIDDTIDLSEYDRVLMHESTERRLMKYKHWTYERAHEAAEKAESKLV